MDRVIWKSEFVLELIYAPYLRIQARRMSLGRETFFLVPYALERANCAQGKNTENQVSDKSCRRVIALSLHFIELHLI